MDLRGYLHSNGNNCTGKSLGLFAYRTSKGVMLVKPTNALIHFDYTRYFHYYRIREVPEALSKLISHYRTEGFLSLFSISTL